MIKYIIKDLNTNEYFYGVLVERLLWTTDINLVQIFNSSSAAFEFLKDNEFVGTFSVIEIYKK